MATVALAETLTEGLREALLVALATAAVAAAVAEWRGLLPLPPRPHAPAHAHTLFLLPPLHPIRRWLAAREF